MRGDAVRCFDELSAARGALGRFTGDGVMPLLLGLAGRALGAEAAEGGAG